VSAAGASVASVGASVASVGASVASVGASVASVAAASVVCVVAASVSASLLPHPTANAPANAATATNPSTLFFIVSPPHKSSGTLVPMFLLQEVSYHTLKFYFF
jgi:hypothetical protein